MRNDIFDININSKTGNVTSIVLCNDSNAMNWCNTQHEWGDVYCTRQVIGEEMYTLRPMKLVNCYVDESSSRSVFSNGKIETTVQRAFDVEGSFIESYSFKTISNFDVFLTETGYGIYTPFCDEYTTARESLALRCHAHIWCGGNLSWVNALRQGRSKLNIGLALREGALASYSIDRMGQKLSNNTRGLIILNPSAVELIPGEEYTISWVLFAHRGKSDFACKLEKYHCINNITAEKYTFFENEKINFSFNCTVEPLSVICNGADVAYSKNGSNVMVEIPPRFVGEHRFEIKANGAVTYVLMNVVKPLEDIIESRISFIVKKQQYTRSDSMLSGAYLIYDNETNRTYYDEDRADHNACRERIGMALLIARYLQKNKNKYIFESLMRYVDFAKREFLNADTGEVCNTVSMDSAQKRLYNAPWAVTLMAELYLLTKDKEYIDIAHRIIRNYYQEGGRSFYPNGFDMRLIVTAMRECGADKYAEEALTLFKEHIANMITNRFDYPRMECVYEQTIVTPVVTFLCDMFALTREEIYLQEAEKHIENLDRFNGMQPDYHLNGIPIRYWDDYWFGKSSLYADVFPHYWSCLTARCWYNYCTSSGNTRYGKMAENCMRNCLCLFNKDGSASCAYVYPKMIDGNKGEFYDAWANDQDFALYFAITILG